MRISNCIPYCTVVLYSMRIPIMKVIALFVLVITGLNLPLLSHASRSENNEEKSTLLQLQQVLSESNERLGEFVAAQNYESAAVEKKHVERIEDEIRSMQLELISIAVQHVTSKVQLLNTEHVIESNAIEAVVVQMNGLAAELDRVSLALRDHSDQIDLAHEVEQAHIYLANQRDTIQDRVNAIEANKMAAEREQLLESSHISSPVEYHRQSRENFHKAVDSLLLPHQELVLGAKAELAKIFADASRQGAEFVTISSVISETGFLTLAIMNAARRFSYFVGELQQLDGMEFGSKLKEASSTILPSLSFGRSELHKVQFNCTFDGLMEMGACLLNDKNVKIEEFRLNLGGQTNRRDYYHFKVLSMLSADGADENIMRNIIPELQDSPMQLSNQTEMREYLYAAWDASKMFHFQVSFDDVPQRKYKEKMMKVSQLMHWSMLRKHLFLELKSQGFDICWDHSNGCKLRAPIFNIPIDDTLFAGHPPHFIAQYQSVVKEQVHSRNDMLVKRWVSVRLWLEVEDIDYLSNVKSQPEFKTVSHIYVF